MLRLASVLSLFALVSYGADPQPLLCKILEKDVKKHAKDFGEVKNFLYIPYSSIEGNIKVFHRKPNNANRVERRGKTAKFKSVSKLTIYKRMEWRTEQSGNLTSEEQSGDTWFELTPTANGSFKGVVTFDEDFLFTVESCKAPTKADLKANNFYIEDVCRLSAASEALSAYYAKLADQGVDLDEMTVKSTHQVKEDAWEITLDDDSKWTVTTKRSGKICDPVGDGKLLSAGNGRVNENEE